MPSPAGSQRFEEALGSANAREALHRLAVALRDEGMSQEEMYLLFEHFLILVRDARPAEDPAYDAIADNMDLIVGGPWAKGGDLFATELSNAQIDALRRDT